MTPSDAQAVLSAQDLRLAYGTQTLFDGISFAIAAGEKVALVGRNGCGKTSLLRVLANRQPPDDGLLSFRRGLRTGYLPQDFELDETLTVGGNMEAGAADVLEWIRRYEQGTASGSEAAQLLEKIEHAGGWDIPHRMRSLATALNAPPLESPIQQLSGGEKRRVALCRCLVGQPDLLILDEPTNHLDADSIAWLERFLADFQGAAVFVTHDRYFLENVATRILELSGGRLFSHQGSYGDYLEARVARQTVAEQQERRRQRFLRAELDYVRAGVRAQRSKSKHRLETYYAVAGLDAPPEEREMDLLLPEPPEIGNDPLVFDGAGYRLDSGRWLFRHLDLVLRKGTCTGIIGRNGAGKSTLVRTALGEIPLTEGRVKIARGVVANVIDQDRSTLDPEKTLLAEIGDGRDFVAFGDRQISTRGYLRRFLFDDQRAGEKIEKLSGGEKARALLAKVLRRGGNLVVLDEPTNDLDLGSLRMFEEALVRFEGTVLVVSHDRYFLDRVCDQIVAFEDGGVHVEPGNYSRYAERRKSRTESRREFAVSPAAETSSRRRRKLTYKEQQELLTIETTILEAEARVAEIEATLDDPSFFVKQAAAAPALVDELDRAKARVEALYARWEELSALQS